MGSRKGSHRSNKRKGVSRGRINAKNSSGPISSKHGSDPFANYTLQLEGQTSRDHHRRTSVIRQIESGCRNLLSRITCDPSRIIRAVESEGKQQ